MNKSPVIILLDDYASMFESLINYIVRGDLAITSNKLEIATFTEDESASQFVADNSSRVIGYIQDIFRPNSSHEIIPAGITFYNLIINQFTPTAKTLFHSGRVYDARNFLELVKIINNQVRIIQKPASIEELREAIGWLITKDKDTSDEKHNPAQETSHLVELLTPPWEEVCKYLSQHPDYLHKINPRKFEMLIAEIFKSYEWEVELTAQTRDGGYDIVAVKQILPTQLRVLVEAKRWSPNKPIGVQVVRSLYGLRAVESFSQVMLATSTYVSEPAKKQFARVVPWELDFIERDAILDWCKTYPGVKLGGHFSNKSDK